MEGAHIDMDTDKKKDTVSSMESVLFGPQSNFGAFNLRSPQKKTSFFSRRPSASSKKTCFFLVDLQ